MLAYIDGRIAAANKVHAVTNTVSEVGICPVWPVVLRQLTSTPYYRLTLS
jgi:hypothetical protein